MCCYSSLQHINRRIQTQLAVLLTAVTDNEVMYISVDKNTEICLYVTVNSVTLTKKRHREDTVSL